LFGPGRVLTLVPMVRQSLFASLIVHADVDGK
jgi:hypothetical protein